MNLFLTFDYELFFGSPTGTAKKCILEPTNRLREIAKKHEVKFTFFIDIGYILQLKKWSKSNPNLLKTHGKIIDQIIQLDEEGHDMQLHIHPHWESASYKNGKWDFTIDNNYKLADLSDEEIKRIVSLYKSALEEIIGHEVTGFRAGGWCLQPFDRFSAIFKEVGIKVDSTVFQGGHLSTKHYFFDFRNAPSKGRYRFENDICTEDSNGSFLELPIGGYKYKPGFFWRLYALGRLIPRRHKMIGDGNFISQGGKKYESLKRPIWDHVSCDGYYASKLNAITKKFNHQDRTDLVIIGHPKSMTRYSLEKLDQYIRAQRKNHTFLTLSSAE
jgi:peptidoglycan/xylan/chitin deacetylase (PgdA/CDA1 family)